MGDDGYNKLAHKINSFVDNIYKIIGGLAVGIGILLFFIYIWPWIEIAIYAGAIGWLALGVITIPLLVIYDWIRRRYKKPS